MKRSSLSILSAVVFLSFGFSASLSFAARTVCSYVVEPCDNSGNHYLCRLSGWTGPNQVSYCSQLDRTAGPRRLVASGKAASGLSCDPPSGSEAVENAKMKAVVLAKAQCDSARTIGFQILRVEPMNCRSWTPYFEAEVELKYICD